MHRVKLCLILAAPSFTQTRMQPTIKAFTLAEFKVE